MAEMVCPVILCGGSGTRLWPLSTPKVSKQFLALTSEKSMIEETNDRFLHSEHSDLIFAPARIVGSTRHQAILNDKLPNAQKILEPVGRNSAPAVAAACLAADPDDLILILPADHDIRDVTAFHAAIAAAVVAAQAGSIVTFGIQPTYPATGYGYIQIGLDAEKTAITPVEKFVEKPDLKTAERYLATNNYLWNAGIFLFKARVMTEALATFVPNVLSGVESAMKSDEAGITHLDAGAFSTVQDISIDYAVMEKARNVKTIPVDMGWSDVGGYHALHELLTDSPDENHVHGRAIIRNSTGSYVRSEGPAVAVNGVSDLIVVATSDEVMVTSMKEDAAAKSLGQTVQSERFALGFSNQLKERVRSWLWQAFEVWSKAAWDPKMGGFVEQIDMAGNPDSHANRRVRVQARQVFSFAKAIDLGWPETEIARDLIDRGLSYMDTKLRHPDRGWVHVVAPNGSVVDQKRDLYDHAFIILAGAAAYRSTGSALGLKIAEDAMSFINSALKDPEHGGWRESDPDSAPRRANPHMHMLEAMLALHDATGDVSALKLAGEIVTLFESRFFKPQADIIAEFFDAEWQLETPLSQAIFEPGHHYEWASLLHMYDQVAGHDSESWRRRLINQANREGLNSATGFARNAVRVNNDVVDENSRLWHQLERFRALCLHPSTNSVQDRENLLRSIFTTYLDDGPRGGWIDCVDARGNALSEYVPASMLYHLATAFSPILI